MIDLLADRVVAPAMRLARQREIVAGEIEPPGDRQIGGRHGGRQIGNNCFGGRGLRVGFPHHHPAHIIQHRLAALVQAPRPHPDHAGLAVGVLLEPDHPRLRAQRIAGIDRLQPAPLGIAEIGHRVQRHVRHGLAEDQVERRPVVERTGRQTAGPGELVRGGQRVARRVERLVERPLAPRDGARYRMGQHVVHRVILEEPPRVGLRRSHHWSPSFMSGV